MLTYTYTGRDKKNGQIVKAEIEADSERAAGKLLLERGITPMEIKPKGERGGLLGFRSRVTSKQKVIFSRQLSTLINSGLPLVQSLSSVRDQTENKHFAGMISKIINDVEAGSAFGVALAKYPKLFDNVYTSLVTAGEASGTLDKSLERLANQQEKDGEITSKIRGAMIYPLIVLVVLFAALTFMLVAVLPQVQNIYKEIPGASLPFITSWLLGISKFFTHFWWIAVLLIAGTVYGLRWWIRRPDGRSIVDELKLKAWPVAPLFKKLYMARFTRTASTLVASGVPMIQMLDTAAKAVGNVHVAASIKKASKSVEGGKSLSSSLKGDPNFLDLVPNMINIGEQSGSLDGMLGKVADYYEKEVDDQIKAISTVIEPLLMVFVGVIALIIVAAVLLPIYSLVGKNVNVL